MEKSTQKTIKATMVITLIIILSKAVGFIREMFVAASFGQGVESDAYTTAYGIISIFTVMFTAGIASTFIPIYTRTKLRAGDLAANRYASNIVNIYIIASLICSALGYIFAPQLVGLIWQNEEGFDLIVSLTRIMIPSLVFWAVSGVFINILDANKKFVPEQIVGFALSVCVITACVAFGNIEAVAYATAITAAVQVAMLVPFLKGTFKYKPRFRFKDRKVAKTFILAIPALISMAFDEINHQTDRIFASSMLIGTVTALQKSYTLVQTALGILIVPITTVMFSELSQYAAERRMDKLKETVKKSLEVIALVTIPIIVIAVINRQDIIAVFYQRGNYTQENTIYTAPVFAWYIAGIFGFGMRNFLVRVFYSLQRTRAPMITGIISVALNIILDFAVKDSMGAMGLTFATSVSSFVGGVLLLILLRVLVGSMGMRTSALEFVKIIAAAFVAGVAAYILSKLFVIEEYSFIHTLVKLIISVFGGLGAYFAMGKLLRIKSMNLFMGIFKKKIKRKA